MMIPNLFAEKQVPEWVKNTAGWWSNDVISETEFVNAIAVSYTHLTLPTKA